MFVAALTACGPPAPAQTATVVTARQPGDGPEVINETGPDYLWLEDVDSERAMQWVAARNRESSARLEADLRYTALRTAAEKNYTATDRIPYGRYYGGRVHNFWQDQQHIKGVLRSTGLDEYRKDQPRWDVALDIDQLALQEGKNWVYKGHDCLAPDFRRCLISLSRGGGDAVEIREFDLVDKVFVDGGFFLPEAKTRVDWLDADHLLVATDFGEGSLTTSGYPRVIKKWRRGTDLATAPVLLEVAATDMQAATSVVHRPEGDTVFLLGIPAFFRENIYLLGQDDRVRQVPLPADVDFRGVFKGLALGLLRSDWAPDPATLFRAGSLISIDLNRSVAAGQAEAAELVYAPGNSDAIDSIAVGRDTILVSILHDVSGALLELRQDDAGWAQRRIAFADNGSIGLVTTDAMSGISLVSFESFLTPDTLYLLREGDDPVAIKSLPPRFDASRFVSEQAFAASADGTRIPYYVVRDRALKRDGKAPTLLGAYGGFEISQTPAYLSALGIEWLKAGGVYATANIRGGGEYGPGWHKAALRENRQKAFDDFIAVSEALIETGITRPDKLGIRGGSNGGLLVMAVTAQRPELYKAVICAVPLLDMLRYHHLSAGASWIGEYGNPDVPAEREFIARYSPYQNISPDWHYPEVFFWTNTRDDRVHPSHARRMVAKMLGQGHNAIYFENTDGGHGGGADPLAQARTTALELVYLTQQLIDQPIERNH